MSAQRIKGIVPVMLTPFTEAGEVDFASLERLTEWYLANGADALFAVCQSSEMLYLNVLERAAVGRFVVRQVNGRVPVVVSGHVSDDPYSQLEELAAAVDTGADGLVLVTNHLDPKNRGAAVWRGNLDWLLARLPVDMPLGLYECPAPYRRLLSDEEFKICVDSGRFVLLKDVSCDLATIRRRVALAQGSPLSVLNANAALAWPAMQAGSGGFNGISCNYHPDLYQWLYTSGAKHPELADELAAFLTLAALSEGFGYPVIAKIYQQRLGNFTSIRSRAIAFDVRERFWALEAIVEQLLTGTEAMRRRIAALGD